MPSLEMTGWKPKIAVIGVGGGGGNAVNSMIARNLSGAEFIAVNTDAQALAMSKAHHIVQLGVTVTEGLGAGSLPELGRAAAEESIDQIMTHLSDTHMCFLTAGMGGGTGTGAAPLIAHTARKAGILTVAVVTEPFSFEGTHRARQARQGIEQLVHAADTVIVVPNQSLFRLSGPHTTLEEAFAMADSILYSGVMSIVELITKEGLINLDFADVRSVMQEMGPAVMATGEASGPGRAADAAKAAVENPLFGEATLKGAKGILVSIAAGRELTLFEVDEAASCIRDQVDADAEITLGATFDESLGEKLKVSIIATGLRRSADVVVLGERVQKHIPVHALR
ncbi:cell division protein FtsZ [Rhizobium sp. R635]|uniref:cell division protein FtsZ n=1 Tax=Rhizobium sp. R635 TaxID=1764275 RepID=UPI000B52F1AA|nr:cell division protein FtsZ [Rhizobium sp. R635]OWV87601.1 cell division protein FtsZ [Rhizobium sp. R635]